MGLGRDSLISTYGLSALSDGAIGTLVPASGEILANATDAPISKYTASVILNTDLNIDLFISLLTFVLVCEAKLHFALVWRGEKPKIERTHDALTIGSYSHLRLPRC